MSQIIHSLRLSRLKILKLPKIQDPCGPCPASTAHHSLHKQDRDVFPLPFRDIASYGTRAGCGPGCTGRDRRARVDTKAASSWCRSVSGYISSWLDSAKYVFPPSGPGWHAMRYVKKCS